MTNIVTLRRPPKGERTQMDTLILTADVIAEWRLPPFQRPLRVNEKVKAIAEEMKQVGGVVSGVITLGIIEKGRKDAGIYLVDGQHRIEAFRLSLLDEGIADVRFMHFDDMGEMGEAFYKLNSAIVRIRPDDVLRALENTIPALKIIRNGCSAVGYDQIRRGTSSPILSMSLLLRCWVGSSAETPVLAPNATQLAKDMSPESAQELLKFIDMAIEGWGRDHEYARLWSALNLTMCMWLWRHLVLTKERGVKRFVNLNPAQFKRAMMVLSAEHNYLDWLMGRTMSERDRSPCYNRIKAMFVKRLEEEFGGKVKLPSPAWCSRI